MGRTKKFLYNTVSTAVLQVVTMAVGFILPKVMLNVYGSEINGLVTSITQFITYLTLVEAGLSGATVYSLYKPIAEEDTHAINSVVVAARNFYYRTGFVFVGLALTGAIVYPLVVETQLLSNFEIGVLFIVLCAHGVLEFFTLAKYRALLTADQKTYVISIATIIQTVVNCAIIWTLSYTGLSIVIVRMVAILAIVLRTVILWVYCRRKYRFLDFSVEPNNAALGMRWDALYFQIIGVVHNGAPIIIATVMLTLNDVSVYSVYRIVTLGINSVLGIFTTGIAAGFGDLLARGDDNAFKKAFQQFEYLYYILVSIVYATLSVSFIPFIRIYTRGADINYVYPIIAALLTINGFFYSIKTPYGMLTISAGKYKESRVPNTIQALIEVVGGVLLSIPWGVPGIIIGALLGNIYRDIDFVFFAPKYLIKYKFRETAVMWVRSFCLFIAISAICYFIPSDGINNYITWFVFTVGCMIAISVVVLLTNYLMDRDKFKACAERVYHLIGRK